MAYHEIFDERILALQNELKNHPDIIEFCRDCKSIEEVLGAIAAKLNILLDGVYDLPDVCGMLALKLKERGTIMLLDPYNTLPVSVKVGENEISVEGVPMPRLPDNIGRTGRWEDPRDLVGGETDTTPEQSPLPKKEE